jgi:hypothetical protein
MNETINKVLIAIGIPVGLMLLCLPMHDGRIVAGVLALLVSFVYLIAGILLLVVESKQLGKALLISGGIVFIAGFSLCAIMFSNLH